jgi:hypothetical protein
MSTPEGVLTASIRRAILNHYPEAWVFKVVGSPSQESGVPDLLVCVAGRLIGLEVKRKRSGESTTAARGRATALQVSQIARLRTAGAAADVVISVQEALDVVHAAVFPEVSREKD